MAGAVSGRSGWISGSTPAGTKPSRRRKSTGASSAKDFRIRSDRQHSREAPWPARSPDEAAGYRVLPQRVRSRADGGKAPELRPRKTSESGQIGNIVGKHHGRRGLRTKRLDIGFYPSGYEAEQTEEKHRSFVRERLQNPVKRFVDAGVPEVHTCLVGIHGGCSQRSSGVPWRRQATRVLTKPAHLPQQILPQEHIRRAIRLQPMFVDKKIVDLVGEDQLFEVHLLLAQRLGQYHGQIG